MSETIFSKTVLNEDGSVTYVNVSEVKEIETIKDYSKQILNEDFPLDDIKQEKLDDIKEKENINNEEIQFKNDIQIEKSNYNSLENKKDEVKEIKTLDSNGLFPIEINYSEYEDKLNKSVKEEKKNSYELQKIEINNKSEDTSNIDEFTENIFEKTQNNVNWVLDDNFRACLIGDLKGNIYLSRNIDKLYPLASVTKIMTLLVTFDAIKAKKISLNSKVRISKNSARQGGSKIGLKAGQVYRLKDLIKASAIYSANNATYAIAEFVGKGSIKRFVRLMNKKVKKLGLQKDLKYYTPAGLPSRMTKQPMDVGTARAIYKLSIEALKYKKYIQIAGIKKTSIRGGKIKLKSRNHLLGIKGIYGIKTGYHKEAKYNITVASKIKNKDYIVVVLGGDTYKKRDNTVLNILDIFKENYDTLTKN
ncbi:MAG: D-alanyl-D-alanine carboxypeptidase [Fusobacteriales bacterium]|nr:MAG: D-alanyl-D-alanine carboxypeptidase [Fusobacteriales bacterium]